jgi:hypothetical protein
MALFRVQQKATIWYETEVEANSEAEAIALVEEDKVEDLEWWEAQDSSEFLPEYWAEEK